MKRRRILQSLAGLPALAALPAPAPAQSYSSTPSAAETIPKLPEVALDAVSDSITRFLSQSQFAALEQLARILLPAANGRPGALDADVPAFLDFLVGQSNPQRQALYRDGLDKLNHDAQAKYSKSFAALSPAEADPLLEPLKAAWTYNPPTDPFGNFLREAKNDIVQATMNSREFVQAGARGRRGSQGSNSYWLPLD
jgi:Gluconate 2-dehydrogenase subunit 3